MSATRITADDDGALSRPPHGPGHLVFGDLAVLRLIAGGMPDQAVRGHDLTELDRRARIRASPAPPVPA